MNMKRIVFAGVGILIMLVIIFWTLHSITHIDEINQKRRDKNQGEALASRIIETTATTSIWDSLRPTESGTDTSENSDESGENQQETLNGEQQAADGNFPEDTLAEAVSPVPQTVTETR